MKIDTSPGLPTATQANALRKQLSMETTFDRTMQQLEARMWPGGRVGSQPTPRLPTALAPSIQAAPVAPLAFKAEADAGAEATSHPPAASVPTGDLTRDMALNLPMRTAAMPGAATGAAIAGADTPRTAACETEDAQEPCLHATSSRSRELPGTDKATHQVTWTDGDTGPALVIRETTQRGVARDALAQARRHGILPRRITINGITLEDPSRHGDSP
jgi:hypothetical protein